MEHPTAKRSENHRTAASHLHNSGTGGTDGIDKELPDLHCKVICSEM